MAKKKTKEVEPTFLGEGPLSGEYRFAEIRGSISASSKDDAIRRAKEILIKHPSLAQGYNVSHRKPEY